MSEEDGWTKPATFCLYQEDVHFRPVRFPIPEWVGRKEYNALLQIQCDMTTKNYEQAFAGLLNLLNKMREEDPSAGDPEKALTEKPSVPATWREDIMALIVGSAPSHDGKDFLPNLRAEVQQAINWAVLWDNFDNFFKLNGISERPYDGPVRTVTDNPQA